MRRNSPPSRRTRVVALGVEALGALAVLYAVSLWSFGIALILLGCSLFAVALLVERGEIP